MSADFRSMQRWLSYLYISLMATSSVSSLLYKHFFDVQTCNSEANSGTTRNVLQPRIFLDLRISPKMWSPMYITSLPLAPISCEKTSQEPETYKYGD